MVIFSNLWGYLLGVLERLQFMRRDWEKIQGFGGGGDPKPNSSLLFEILSLLPNVIPVNNIQTAIFLDQLQARCGWQL